MLSARCPICSPAAGSPISSNAWCATRSDRRAAWPNWKAGSPTAAELCRRLAQFLVGDWKAAHPLQQANVVLEEKAHAPGEYEAKFFLRPHYQMEGLTVALRLVSRMPAP
ncbi:MAG: hypothetical protein WDN04_09950 [Rhodospirillales bacterium]